MKKLLSILLTAVLIFSMFSMTSFSAEAADKSVSTARVTETAFSIADFFENLIQSIDDFFAELFGAGKKLPDVSEWTDEEIINYYISAAKKSNETAVSEERVTFDYIDDEDEDSVYESMFPVIQNTINNNVYEFNGITGDFENLTVDDCESVDAYKKGRHIIVDIVLKNQSDNVKNEEVIVNTISHGMSIVDKQGLKVAFDELGFGVDISEGNVVLNYTNAKISVRIDSDGYIRKGKWSHNMDVDAENVKFIFNGIDIPMNMDTGFTLETKTGYIF